MTSLDENLHPVTAEGAAAEIETAVVEVAEVEAEVVGGAAPVPPAAAASDAKAPRPPVARTPVAMVAVSAVIAAVLAAGGVYGLAISGLLPVGVSRSADAGAETGATAKGPTGGVSNGVSGAASAGETGVEARLDQLSRRLDAFGNMLGKSEASGTASAPKSGAPVVLPDAEGRFRALEDQGRDHIKQLAAQSGELAATAGRLGTLEDGQKTFAAGLDRRITALDRRIAALEALEKQDETERHVAAAALAVTALDDAMASGHGFAAELQAVTASLPDFPGLKDLESYAADGVPKAEDIIRDFPAPAILASITVPDNASLLERLTTSAKSWVNYRSTTGSGTDTTVAAIDAALARGDLAEASRLWRALPPAGKAASAAWGRALEGRLALDAAAKALSERIVSTFGVKSN